MQVPATVSSDTFRFRCRRRTRWSDEDNQRVVNNAVYMTLLEDARHEYFTQLGLLENNQFPFVLMQTNIRFLAPCEGGQEVEIELRTLEFGTSSIHQVARIWCPREERTYVEAEVLLVSWNNERRCKAPTNSAFIARVQEFEGLPGLDESGGLAESAGPAASGVPAESTEDAD